MIDPALARLGGTVVNTAGECLLFMFDGIVPAMRFAVDVQRGDPRVQGRPPKPDASSLTCHLRVICRPT